MNQKIEDELDTFELAIETWNEMSLKQRQDLMNHIAFEITMESLMDAGIVTGELQLDLNICRMIFGYAYAKGYRPTPASSSPSAPPQPPCA